MDVTRGGNRTYLYYLVDPTTWHDAERVHGVTGGSIARSVDDELLERATIQADASAGLDERYLRVYQLVRQGREAERICMGTFLMQCPDEDFDGTRASVEAQGFSVLKELADDEMPVGYQARGDAAAQAAAVMRSHMRARVLAPSGSSQLDGAVTAGESEKCLSYVGALLSPAGLRLSVDERGTVSVAPARDAASLRPVWTFRDDDSSVILPRLRDRSGLRDVPNVVRVVHSGDGGCLVGEAVNDDPSSPASTVRRGRVVPYTVSDPDLPEDPTQPDVDQLAARTLREKSACEREVTFWHAYVPEVTPGCAVELDYTRAGKRIVAVVAAQGIDLSPECTVECRARYTEQLWRG